MSISHATVAGLTPLLLEKSLRSRYAAPLAASLAFGLVTASTDSSWPRWADAAKVA